MFIRRKPRVREVNGERTMINNREQVKRILKLDQIALEFNLQLTEVFQKYTMINYEVYVEFKDESLYNEKLEQITSDRTTAYFENKYKGGLK